MNLRNILIAATAMSAIAGGAFAQASATATAPADAAIISPLSMTADAATKLSFGTIVKPSSGAAVVRVSTAASRSLVSGNAVLAGGGTPAAASFTIAGEGAKTFSVTAANFDLTGPASTTAAVTPILSSATGTISGTAGTTGSAALTVGGDLALSSTMPNGAYTGTLSVTIAYN